MRFAEMLEAVIRYGWPELQYDRWTPYAPGEWRFGWPSAMGSAPAPQLRTFRDVLDWVSLIRQPSERPSNRVPFPLTIGDWRMI